MPLPLRRQERSSEQPSRSYSPKDLCGKNGIIAIPVQLRRTTISRLAPLQFASNDSPTVSAATRTPIAAVALPGHPPFPDDHLDVAVALGGIGVRRGAEYGIG